MLTTYAPGYLSGDLLSTGAAVSRKTEKRTLTSWARMAVVGRVGTFSSRRPTEGLRLAVVGPDRVKTFLSISCFRTWMQLA